MGPIPMKRSSLEKSGWRFQFLRFQFSMKLSFVSSFSYFRKFHVLSYFHISQIVQTFTFSGFLDFQDFHIFIFFRFYDYLNILKTCFFEKPENLKMILREPEMAREAWQLPERPGNGRRYPVFRFSGFLTFVSFAFSDFEIPKS